MKAIIYILLSGVVLFISSCDNSSESKPSPELGYTGNWSKYSYAFNGNIGVDTISIKQINDSLFFSDINSDIDTGLVKSDTIFMNTNHISSFIYLTIQSNKRFRSNVPVNRTFDSIVFNKLD